MKRVLVTVAGVLVTALTGLAVYAYYLLRDGAKKAKSHAERVYTR